MYNEIILTIFEVYPYEIYIMQDTKGNLITIKTYKDGRRR